MASIYNEAYWRLFKVIWKISATMRPQPSKIWIFGLILATKHPTGKVCPGLKMISRPVEFMTKRCELLGKKWCDDSFQRIKCDWELYSDPYYSSKPIWKWFGISLRRTFVPKQFHGRQKRKFVKFSFSITRVHVLFETISKNTVFHCMSFVYNHSKLVG